MRNTLKQFMTAKELYDYCVEVERLGLALRNDIFVVSRRSGISYSLEGLINHLKTMAIGGDVHFDELFDVYTAVIPSYDPLIITTPTIKNVIFNGPATVVYWSDGSKTVVKCQPGEVCDYEKGLAMAISKKVFGNCGSYYDEFKKWIPEDEHISMDPIECLRNIATGLANLCSTGDGKNDKSI